MGKLRLTSMFLVLLVALFAASIIANYYWTASTMRKQMENELVEKAQVLSQQMDAVWTFMSANQEQLEQIAYTETGSYMGLHCAIVGRSVGLIFSQETNYTTRFVNFNPRNKSDSPDQFETDALNTFLSDRSIQEYYSFSTFDGQEVFRYSAPMKIQENCLSCHGEPAGEIDITGYKKEGWKIGDVGGAISVIIPLDIYMQNEKDTILQSLLFFGMLLMIFAFCIWFALSYLVTRPLHRIQTGVQQVQRGDLNMRLSPAESSREVSDLVHEFNSMSHELATIYNDLESQVRDRTLQLSAANKLLENQRAQLEDINKRLIDENRYKSDFLAMMSHELRTPLTSIIAFSRLLNKKATLQKDKDFSSVSSEIEANSQLLLTIINDILDMSRIDAGKAELNLEVVDFGDLISSVEAFMRPMANLQGIAVGYSVESDVPLAFADFDKLHHILVNLISNAVKFTAEDGCVQVSVTYDAETDEIALSVKDTGIGIDKANQVEIFERFRQIDSSVSRKYNGTGLGLALVKEYAEMHGGSASVLSEVGKGSIFVVRITAKIDEGDREL